MKKSIFKQLIILSFLSFSFVLFTNCSKDKDNKKTDNTDDKDPNSKNLEGVYIAGYEFTTRNNFQEAIRKLWKDGVEQTLNGNALQSKDVWVTDKDVYVATTSGIYKNGELLYEGGSRYAIFIDNNDVYSSGYKSQEGVEQATIWKNNDVLYTLSTNTSLAYSIFVKDGDVYAAGSETVGFGMAAKPTKAKVWKNGTVFSTLDNSNGTDDNVSIAYSIFIKDNNIYVAGKAGKYANLWTNGVVKHLSDGSSFSSAKSVYIRDSDVYVVTSEDNNIKRKIKVWKNDTPQELTDGSTYCDVEDVFVKGNDVYVVGYKGGEEIQDRDKAILWKNGVEQVIASSSDAGMYANAVFVK